MKCCLLSLLYNRHQLNVSVDLPTQTSAAVTDQMNLETVLNNLQTTAFHLLGKIATQPPTLSGIRHED